MMVHIQCPYCGFSKEIPREKIPKGAKRAICPKCKQRFDLSGKELLEGPEPNRSTGARWQKRGPSPWERRNELGLWQGIWMTIKEVLLGPDKLFQGLHFKAGQGEPLAFGLLVGSVGSMFGFFWQVVMVTLGIVSFGPPLLEKFGLLVIFMVLLVMVPLFVLVSIYIYSGVLHLLLILVRAANNGFEATFRVVCFSQATQILGVIPLFGGWISGLWQLVVQIIGLKEIHETSYIRVIIAYLIPIVLVMLVAVAVLLPLFIFFMKGQPLSEFFPFHSI